VNTIASLGYLSTIVLFVLLAILLLEYCWLHKIHPRDFDSKQTRVLQPVNCPKALRYRLRAKGNDKICQITIKQPKSQMKKQKQDKIVEEWSRKPWVLDKHSDFRSKETVLIFCQVLSAIICIG
jgi:hypothetical protein